LVATTVFVVIRLIPGDPSIVMAGPDATPVELALIRTQLGLTGPLWQQYLSFLGSLLRGSLGISIRTNQPVSGELLTRFPATMELAISALVLATVIAVPLGIMSAVRRGSSLDQAARVTTLLGVGMPVFWLALLGTWAFAYKIPIFPVSGRLDPEMSLGRITGFAVPDAIIQGHPDIAWSAIHHLALPAIVLALPVLAISSRLMRASLLEVLGEDYIRTARAKGLGQRTVLLRHGLRNALQPVITVLGLQLAVLLSGTILVEQIFAWPGIGSYVYQSIQSRDYPVVQGAILLFALVYVFVNTLVDIGYGLLDPQTRTALMDHQ
jgi:peptide/nickel transport system permease protein